MKRANFSNSNLAGVTLFGADLSEVGLDTLNPVQLLTHSLKAPGLRAPLPLSLIK
jgi:uncharacterized protein YjbI with pentapeptide repeats